MIQFSILSWFNCRLLASKLSHPFAILCIYLGILFLTLRMSSETYDLLAKNFHPIRTFLWVTSVLFVLLPQNFKLLLLILLIGVCLMYSYNLLLLCLSQCHESPSVLIILRQKLSLLLWARRPQGFITWLSIHKLLLLLDVLNTCREHRLSLRISCCLWLRRKLQKWRLLKSCSRVLHLILMSKVLFLQMFILLN